MSVKYLDPTVDMSQIERMWTALGAGVSSYFLSWGWIENWLRSLPAKAKVRLVVVEEGQQPLFAFFVGSRSIRRRGFVSSRALFLTETGIPDCDRLCVEQNAVLALAGVSVNLHKIVESLPGPWDEFFLSAVQADSPLIRTSPPNTKVLKTVPSAYVDLDKVRSAPDYLQLLGSSTRWRIRRAYRGYTERYGPIRLEVASNLEQAQAIYAELKELHQARWQSKGLPGAFCSDYFDRFHLSLIASRFASDEIQLMRVQAGERVIGCLYNLLFNGRVFFYQSGFTFEDDNHLKPGYVCHTEAIRHNAGRGMGRYDFLGKNDRYKLELATSTEDVIWAVVQKPKFSFALEEWLRRLKQTYWKPGVADRKLQSQQSGS
jgi:CelD/BcsL family acetyltransferase involved in cellulose biosynthesis